MAIVSSSWGRVLICKVGAELTCQANPRLEDSWAVWARDGGSCRGLDAIFPCLAALFCCICSSGFRFHLHLSCASASQESWSMVNVFWDAFKLSLNKRFSGAPRERFPSCSSPNSSFLRSRWSAIRTVYPAQRSCDCFEHCEDAGEVRTSVSGIFSCHFMLSNFRRLVV